MTAREVTLPPWLWVTIGALAGVFGSYAFMAVWMYRAYTVSGRWQMGAAP